MSSALQPSPILIKLNLFQQIFEKSSNVKFHEHPFSGSRVVPCGRTDGRTDKTKLIVAFRDFANASKKGLKYTKYEI